MTGDPTGRGRRYIPDILDAMQAIRSFIGDMDYGDFADDLKTQYAVHYAFGIIGEAAKRVPADVQREAPDVDWRGMAGMRDFIVHSYDHVSPGLVWQTIEERFPIEGDALRQLLDTLDADDV